MHKENKMAQNLVSEEQVKDAFQIKKFSEISKDKIMEFVSLIPNMDKEVAIAIINQFPVYADSANNMVAQLNVMCDNVIKYGVPIVGGALLLAAAILGVNVKGTKIPTIKK